MKLFPLLRVAALIALAICANRPQSGFAQTSADTESAAASDRNYATLGEDCPCSIYVPNAISPDGDQVNEVLQLQASCPVFDFHIEVFDRWGQRVFESFDAEFQWHGGYEGSDTYNGYYVQNTVYNYRLTYKWGTEEGISINTETQRGWISVLR